VTKFIYHGVRNRKINKGLTLSACLICNKQEDWDQIIKSDERYEDRRQFIINLHNKLMKTIPEEWKQQVIDFLSDIVNYFNNEQ